MDNEPFEARYLNAFEQATNDPIGSDDATTSIKNLKLLYDCMPTPDPDFVPEPTTFMGKAGRVASRVLDNETARTLIKAGGAFAGVALVVWTQVQKDHVLDRSSMAQANQSPIK